MESYVEIGQMTGYRLYTDPSQLRVKQVFTEDSKVEEYVLSAEQFMELLDKVEEYTLQRRKVKNLTEEYRLLAKQRGIEFCLSQWTQG